MSTQIILAQYDWDKISIEPDGEFNSRILELALRRMEV